MKRTIWIGITAAALTVALGGGPAGAGPITQREARQRARIHQGVRSGELTPRETNVLRHEQRGIEQLRGQALADGHVDARERAALVDAQDQASHDIYRLKHNQREVPQAQ